MRAGGLFLAILLHKQRKMWGEIILLGSLFSIYFSLRQKKRPDARVQAHKVVVVFGYFSLPVSSCHKLTKQFSFPFFSLSFFLAVYYWSRSFCSCYCAYRQWPSPPRDPGWCNHHQLPLNQHVFISVIFQSSDCAAPEQSVNQSPKQKSRQRERKRFREENLIFF